MLKVGIGTYSPTLPYSVLVNSHPEVDGSSSQYKIFKWNRLHPVVTLGSVVAHASYLVFRGHIHPLKKVPIKKLFICLKKNLFQKKVVASNL